MKFYEDERLRWPELCEIHISDEWARRALKKLTRHFRIDYMPFGYGPVPLVFRGRSWSWGGYDGIRLAQTRDWLIFCHEFAHVWEYRQHGETWHRPRLAQYVDAVCLYVVSKRWHHADLDAQVDVVLGKCAAHHP